MLFLAIINAYSICFALIFLGVPQKNVLSQLVIQPVQPVSEKHSFYPIPNQQSSSTLFLSKTVTQKPVIEERKTTTTTKTVTNITPNQQRFAKPSQSSFVKQTSTFLNKRDSFNNSAPPWVKKQEEDAALEGNSKNLNSPRISPKLPPLIRRSEGEPIKLEVNIIGNPAPEVFWYKDNILLKNTPEIRLLADVTPEKDVHALLIPELFPEDNGLYKIIARNLLGTDESDCRLVVEG